MDLNTTLADLLALNLHECEEEVKNIVDKAVKEMSMEKVLKDLNTTWSNLEFEQEIHTRTQCILLRASEELIETLEENQVNEIDIQFFNLNLYTKSKNKTLNNILGPTTKLDNIKIHSIFLRRSIRMATKAVHS